MAVKKTLNSISLLFFLLIPLLSYAQSATTTGIPATVPATIIQFSEYEQSTGTHPITMTITDNYLRIDDSIRVDDSIKAEGSIKADGSIKDNGFVLYDRKQKVIYSISSEEQQIIKINFVPVTIASPIELRLYSIKLPADENAPLINGKKTQNHQVFVNDMLCYNLLTVPGLMPDAVTAMSDFNQVLAGQQAETLRYIPADLHEACDLARHTFYPQSHLENGFPLIAQAIDKSGKIENIKHSRAVINYEQQRVPARLFVLPEYSIVPIN